MRQDLRTEYAGGACGIISECIAVEYGYREDGGCYITADGAHIEHMWNRLPDGRILDVTADQFNDGADIRITRGDNPRYSPCGCGKDG